MAQTVAILTKDRPEAFQRCVESLRANTKLFNQDIRLVVSDDSCVSQEQNLSILRDSGLPFVHCDRAFKDEFAQSLATKIPEVSCSVEFALAPKGDPIAMGAARNFLLLALLGQKFIMLDDDMECKFAPIPGSNDEIAYTLGPEQVSQDNWVYRGGDFIDVDFIAAHQRLLDLVPFTVGGSCGDSGMGNVCHLFAHKKFMGQMDSAETLDYVLTQRQLLRATARPQVSRWVNCTGMSMGLDATTFLPPFLPVQRGEDTLFGYTIGNCLGKNGAYVNYAMHHTPRRTSDLSLDIQNVTQPTMSAMLVQTLVLANPHSLSEFCTAVCFMSPVVTASRWREEFLEKLPTADVPQFVLDKIQRLKAALRTTRSYSPIGMTWDEFSIRRTQFARLLIDWSQIVDAAAEVRCLT